MLQLFACFCAHAEPKTHVVCCGSGQIDGAKLDRQHIPLAPGLCGHLVNHPPRHTSPNAVPIPFTWPRVFELAAAAGVPEASLRGLGAVVPNHMEKGRLWYVDGCGEPVFVPPMGAVFPRSLHTKSLQQYAPGDQNEEDTVDLGGLALVTSRRVCGGEELFFDYAIPRQWQPSWYHEPSGTASSFVTPGNSGHAA
jgi:hypothetical protein